MTAFKDIKSTERFIAYIDEYDDVAIKPVKTSEMWEYILEDNWWNMFEERHELEGLFGMITGKFRSSGFDIVDVALDVEYSFQQPPGLKALQFGYHVGTTAEGWMFKAEPVSWPKVSRELQFVTGFVREITMEPLG